MRADPSKFKGAAPLTIGHNNPAILGTAITELHRRRALKAISEPLGIREAARAGTLEAPLPEMPATTDSPLAKARDYHHLALRAGLRAISAEPSPKRWGMLCELAAILGVPRDSLSATLLDLASPQAKAQLREDLKARAGVQL